MRIIKRIALITFLVLLGLFILGLALPEPPKTQTEVQTEVQPPAVKEVIEETPAPTLPKFTMDQIVVNFVQQGTYNGKQKLVTGISNTSAYTFSGKLQIIIREQYSEKLMGYDYIYIDELKPGQGTWAITWIDPAYALSIDQKWSSIEY